MRQTLFLGLALLAAGSATGAAAAPAASSGLERFATPLADDALADQRGKFITPAGIGYFGVELRTAWQGPDGITTNATLLFSVNLTDGASAATPVLLIGYDRSNGDPTLEVAPGNNAIAIPAGLGSVTGAVQSQQLAGNDNNVSNAMRIVIAPNAVVAGNPAGAGLTPVTQGSEIDFADGDRLAFVTEGNRLGLQIVAANGDVVRQGVNGDLGQAAQNVVLLSSGNDVRNAMTLTVGYDPTQAARAINLTGTGALRGLGL